jgi:hypothetical protein
VMVDRQRRPSDLDTRGQPVHDAGFADRRVA